MLLIADAPGLLAATLPTNKPNLHSVKFSLSTRIPHTAIASFKIIFYVNFRHYRNAQGHTLM